MAVQLLEDWLLKEQEKILTTYRELNQAPLKEPDLIFIGDSIVEYFPIHELLHTITADCFDSLCFLSFKDQLQVIKIC